MKKALCLSLLIHGVILAGDMGIGYFFDKELNIPKTKNSGLSVEILSKDYTPSILSRQARKKTKRKKNEGNTLRLHKKIKTEQNLNRNNAKYNSPNSKANTAALSFSGEEYRAWLLEYYSILLKKIKTGMQDLGINAGNLSLIIEINKKGGINAFNIVSSDYGINTESRIKTSMSRVNLPPFPENLNKESIIIKLTVVYK